MKKKFFLLSSIIISLFPATGLAAIIGENYANIDTNIRITPHATAQRIGHFKKGQKVMVKKILGKWCHVEYKKYRQAYVYCPLLKNGSTAKKTNQPAPLAKKSLTLDEISLTYSKDWQMLEGMTESNDSLTFTKTNGDKSLYVFIARIELASEADANAEVDNMIKNLLTDTSSIGLKIVSQENISIPVGRNFYKTKLVVFESGGPKMDIISNEYLIGTLASKDNKVYIVGGTSPKSDESIEEVKNIIKTFKVK